MLRHDLVWIEIDFDANLTKPIGRSCPSIEGLFLEIVWQLLGTRNRELQVSKGLSFPKAFQFGSSSFQDAASGDFQLGHELGFDISFAFPKVVATFVDGYRAEPSPKARWTKAGPFFRLELAQGQLGQIKFQPATLIATVEKSCSRNEVDHGPHTETICVSDHSDLSSSR